MSNHYRSARIRAGHLRACVLGLFAAVCCFAPAAFAADSPDGIWTSVPEAAISRSAAARQITPSSYRTVRLQRNALESLLAKVPLERDVPVQRSIHTLTLPLPDGSYGDFSIVESPIMEPTLAAKFPEIRTWLGQGIDDPTATARFDLTPTGFHAQIISWQGTVFVDPFQPGDTEHYISYRKGDVSRAEPMVCGVTGKELPADLPNFQKRGSEVKLASGSQLRTYRLAVAATGEYTAFHGGTVPLGLAAVVTTINRVNGIYEREVAVRMVLVANNNLLIYTNAGSDPYTNNDGFAMLAENQTNVTSVIGSANYDFGHVVSTGGGGVAGLGVICSNSQKARGVTGSGAPVGDPFDVDYVAHEIGHQFGGNHTFNSTQDSCGGGNRNTSTAYEAGSGITIQAYAGICAPDNVQNNSVDYFHRASLNEILAHVTGSGGTCAAITNTGNAEPVVDAPAAFIIPAGTPFELTASGSDGNGDALTYLWEDYKLGVTNPAGSLSDNGGPLFRNYSPVTSPSRTFPALTYILNNANVPPASAWELLPSVTRSRDFRVTVRDNRAGGGGTNEDVTTVSVTSTAGPFQVTAPNTAISWLDAANQTVSWNVANTTAAPVSTANVRIRLSTDGGNTWPITLAESVPNNGSASVFVPASVPATTQARIRVEAVNNIYFDVSNTNFTITDNPNPNNEPVLSIAGSQVITGNNLIEPNECNQLNITLSNSGSVAATGVSATLSTSDPNVTVTQAVASFPDIAAGGSQTSSAPFQLSTGNSLVCLSDIDLSLNVTYGGGGSPFVGNLILPVGEPAVLGNYVFTADTAAIPAGGTLVPGSAADDAVVDLTVPTGFNFSVYDTAVSGGSTLRVSTNGTLQIVGSAGSSGYTNGALPSAGNSDAGNGAFSASLPVLMPYWDDLAPNAVTGGGIFQQVTGSAPNRKWIIEWRGKRFSAGGSTITTNVAIEFSEGSSSFAYLYGTVDNGGATATIGVQSATTGTDFTQFSFDAAFVSNGQRLTATRSSSGGGCTAGTGPCAAAGVTVTESGGGTAASEGGSDTYSVVLTSQPSANVVISITGDAQVSRAPASLTFTTANWDTPQNVTLTAVDDRTVEGTHSGTVTHSASGGGYDAVNIASVVVSISDNDSATYQFTAASNSVGEGTASANISVSTSFTVSGTGSIGLAAPISIPFTVNAASSASGGGVDYTLASSSVAVPVDGATQNISVAIVNDALVEAAETLILDLGAETGGSAAQQAVVTLGSPASHTLTIIDNDIASVVLTQSGGTTAATEGATDSYSLVLTSQPTSNVVISITGDAQVSRAPASLTFTTANWDTPQNVTVTAINDRTVEGTHSGTLTHSASGGGYGAVSIANVVVNISDNDSATYQFTAASSDVGETTANASISVSTSFTVSGTGSIGLAAPITIPFTVNAASSASGGGVDYTLASSSVAVPVDGTTQNINVAIVDDALVESAETLILDLGAETGGSAAQQAAVTLGSPASHTLTIIDSDSAGVVVTESGGSTTATEGAGDSYSLVLTSQPSADVVISITPDSQVTRAPASLTFTTANWDTPQNVTLTAVDDRTVEGTHSGTVTHSASGGGYDAVNIASVVVSISDNDSATYQFTAASSDVGEATATASISVSTSFTVSGTGSIGLAAPISIPFTVNAASSASGGGVDYSLASSSVAVPADGTTQVISVAITDDALVEGSETLVLDLGAETGGNAAQQAVVTPGSPASHTLTIIDNDGANVTAADVVEPEGDAAGIMQFELMLDADVPGGLDVNYQTRDDSALAGSDYVAASGSVSFSGTAGESRSISIGILGDLVPEADERFFVDLSSSNPDVAFNPASVSGEIFNDDLIADLQVSLQRVPGTILPGGPISYQVEVQNLSNVVAVPSADFQFTASAQHTSITWTCAAGAGSSCPASGNAAPSHVVSLGANSGVSYTINAIVAAGAGAMDVLSSEASISPVAPYNDQVTANNSDTVDTPLSSDLVFEDGFETP